MFAIWRALIRFVCFVFCCVEILDAADQHTKSVNCVRWSPNGQFLASGIVFFYFFLFLFLTLCSLFYRTHVASDDWFIFIWYLAGDTGATKLFGSNETVYESWKVSQTLRSHSGDITDVAWSPDSSMLVSCSLNHELFVWSVARDEHPTTPLARLVGHTTMIKGVAWDPINRYIASATPSELKVWRVADWQLEATLEDAFDASHDTTYFRRASWSPDGQQLTCAGSVNHGNATALALARGVWKDGRDLVGHTKPTVVAAWNGAIFTRPPKAASSSSPASTKSTSSSSSSPYAVCAVGSQDCSVSIWTTQNKRSILVAAALFDGSVLDLRWCPLRHDMLGCASLDGTVAFFLFLPNDIGVPLSLAETRASLAKVFFYLIFKFFAKIIIN